jgi:hypothetical protein
MTPEVVIDLYRSPIFRSFVIFGLIVGVGCLYLPARTLTQVIDCYIVAVAAVYFYRFWHPIMITLREWRPSPEASYLVGVAGVILATAEVRILRLYGIIGTSTSAPFILAMISAMLVISMSLITIAPPIHDGRIRLKPYSAIALVIGGGTMLWLLVGLLKIYF